MRFIEAYPDLEQLSSIIKEDSIIIDNKEITIGDLKYPDLSPNINIIPFAKYLWNQIRNNRKYLLITDEFVSTLEILNLGHMIIDEYDPINETSYHKYYPFVVSKKDAIELIMNAGDITNLIIHDKYFEEFSNIFL